VIIVYFISPVLVAEILCDGKEQGMFAYNWNVLYDVEDRAFG
jgi:hypothetical protein